jgi:hypothetical protein
VIASLASFLFAVLALAGGILILVNWKNLTLLLKVHYGRIYGQGFSKLVTFPATISFGILLLVAAAFSITEGVLYLP